MGSGFAKACVAVGIAAVLWTVNVVHSTNGAWLRAAGAPPAPVRILQFYATSGLLTLGEKAQLCYGVENAKSVRISPMLDGIYPSAGRCVDIVPEHTTHYTILAEGFDGRVVAKSFTLPVQSRPVSPRALGYFALRGVPAGPAART